MNENIITILAQESGQRIDKFIVDEHNEFSRSYIQKLVKEGHVTISGKPVKSNYRVVVDDEISLLIPDPIHLNVEPENIPLDILYEDSDVIVINKSKDMVVHPAPGHYTGTIVNALLYHCRDNLSGINGVLRPGIVHRIDRNTTGVIVVCKNDHAHNFIAEQLKEHSITRRYQAIVFHSFSDDSGKIEYTIGRHPTDRKKMAADMRNGKSATTHYKVLNRLNGRYTHIECTLETGRTHQIRVHMAKINHPIVGDDVYGPDRQPFALEGQALHAAVLGFIHPTTKKYMEFEAPLPDYFVSLLEKITKTY